MVARRRLLERFRRLLPFLLLQPLLSGCSGIPIRSVPQLLRLQSTLLEANPGDFLVAVLTDARINPPRDIGPIMQLELVPRVPGGFEPVIRRLPMTEVVASPRALALPAAGAGEHWLVYRFTVESARELEQIQTRFRQLRDDSRRTGGGRLSVGIEQDGLLPTEATLAHARWESWLRVDLREGPFELWSGTVQTLREQARKAAESRRVAR